MLSMFPVVQSVVSQNLKRALVEFSVITWRRLNSNVARSFPGLPCSKRDAIQNSSPPDPLWQSTLLANFTCFSFVNHVFARDTAGGVRGFAQSRIHVKNGKNCLCCRL